MNEAVSVGFKKLGTSLKSNLAKYADNVSFAKHADNYMSNAITSSLKSGISDYREFKQAGADAETLKAMKDQIRSDRISRKAYRNSDNMSEKMEITSDFLGIDKGQLGAELVSSYYGANGNTLTKGQKIARYGEAGVIGLGGVIGGMAGARFVTGGSLTRNGKGEKDIMGVPFI